jgi:hypothetical protein
MIIFALKIGDKTSFRKCCGAWAVHTPKLNLTLKMPKTLINQGFLTKNKNYNFDTYQNNRAYLVSVTGLDENCASCRGDFGYRSARAARF